MGQRGFPIGKTRVWPPVVLAPMAGVTDYPFRALCRTHLQRGLGPTPNDGSISGLFVSEMVSARSILERNRTASRLASFGSDEGFRSLQLYGSDPEIVEEATRYLVGEGLVDHIDMNFGCPVPKITRTGGGAAIPARPRLLARIVRAAVRGAADEVPVTIKFRKGIDDSLITFRDAGRIGQEEGCAAVGLHARTAREFYQDGADWDAIAELVQLVTIPVLGNGDIWEADDAKRMMSETGCAGVIIGRGCLGNPWLFAALARVFLEGPSLEPPDFGAVADEMLRHASAMVRWVDLHNQTNHDSEVSALRAFRKHAGWYVMGFRHAATLREALMQVERVDHLREVLAGRDRNEPYPAAKLRGRRGKRGRLNRVVLPAGFRERLDDDEVPVEPASLASGG